MAEILKKSYEISIWEDVLTTEYWPKDDITIGEITYVKNENNVPADIAIEYCESQHLNFDDVFNTIQYYDEERVAVIGSDTMDSPTRAFEPNLKRNINGTVTLNFFTYIRYYDEETDSYRENPFIESLLVNERKLKFRYGNEWFDCIIKNADEDKENNIIMFTTTDLFINELSKTGFSLEFETDLGNNIGTIGELARAIVDGTEWEIDEVNDFIERQESNLYNIVLNNSLTATSLLDEQETITLSAGTTVYGFYQSVVDWEDKDEPRVQVIYSPTEYIVDEDRIIFEKIDDAGKYDADEYWITPSEGDITVGDISYQYKGKRLIQSTNTIYDPVAKKVVERYLDQDDNEVYMYYENKYYATSVVNNLISNGEKFVNDECWISNPAGEGMVFHSIYPSIDNTFPIEQFHNFLCFSGAQNNQSRAFLNTGFVQNLADYTGFAKSDKYVFRISYGKATTDAHGIPTALPSPVAGGNGVKSIKVQDYKINSDGSFKFGGNIYFNFNTTAGAWHTAKGDYNCYNMFSGTQFSTGIVYYEKEGDLYVQTTDTVPDASKRYYYRSVVNDYIYCVDQCNTALSYSKMLSGIRDYTYDDTSGWQIGVFIQFEAPGSGKDYYVEGIQLFQYQEDATAVVPVGGDPADYILLPGMIPQSSVTKNYYYYNKPQPDFTNIEEVEWRYKGTEKQAEFTPIIEEGLDKYIKRRTITVKESNRFNLIQSLCELFECWAKFNVERDNSTGKILKEYLEDENGVYSEIRRKKSISFLEYVGKDNWAGFKYGVNLKQINRQNASDQIVTKLIVKNNSNEHAINGFCTIARADENPSYSNFILNVDYYIRQGMLSNQEWLADLYTDVNGHLGYYKKLNQYKKDFEDLSIEKAEINRTIDNLESDETVYQSIVNESIQSRDFYIDMMYGLTKKTVSTPLEDVLATLRQPEWRNNEEAQDYLTEYEIFSSNIAYYTPALEAIQAEIYSANVRAKEIDDIIDEAKARVDDVEAKFYRRYARYIQEGSWISEDYVDDNLYYLDAESVLYTSAFPKVSYSINVIDCLKFLEDGNIYEYGYTIGDKTFIEDTEFFGYYLKDGIPTPYQEEVVVSETVDYFDEPEKNTITIQNYKTQFEDLFQRITATTQSLQYSTGEYQRAAGAVYADGTIDPTLIQNSIVQNAINLSNAKNQSVQWGSDGITTTNLSNPLEILRITSGGLYISSDGGVNYTAGVSAYGINTSLLSAGRINSENINIYSGSFPTFIWDKYGISAYVFGETENGQAYVDYGKFVRYDQYGLYGIEATLADPTIWRPNPNDPLNDIEDKAKFGLLWDRFFLKSDAHGGRVRISSTDDIQVLDANNNERIKIGRLTDEDIASYGIRIANADEEVVMENDDNGNLWLKNNLFVGDGSNSNVTIGYGNENYYPTQDTERQSGKTYYIYHSSSDSYEEYTEDDFAVGITYYEQKHEIINSNGNFIVYSNGSVTASQADITGVINATSGHFRGDVYAESGMFNGTINALDGTFAGDVTAGNAIIGPNGLIIYDNGITIYKKSTDYFITEDLTKQDGKTYYYKDENDEYIEFTGDEFEPGVIYYERKDDEPILYTGESGDLTVVGTIYANDGSFSGSIDAKNGFLGDLEISGQITAGNLQINSDGSIVSNYTEGQSGFKLDPNGTVYANNIELGTGAKISKYLQVGTSAFIYDGRLQKNVDITEDDGIAYSVYNNGDVLSIAKKRQDSDEYDEALCINSDGLLTVGGAGRIQVGGNSSTDKIIIDAGTSLPYIETGNYKTNGVGWHIDGNNSIFNNITARGAIKSAVFEYNELQAVGGTIIIRPSATITGLDLTENKITVSATAGFKKGDYCLFSPLDEYGLVGYKVTELNEANKTLYFEDLPRDTETGQIKQSFIQNIIGMTVVSMGNGTELDPQVGLSLNSSGNNSLSGILPQSLTIFSSYIDNEQIVTQPRVILGLLPESLPGLTQSYHYDTERPYGLYAEGAYIKGAIVSYDENEGISSGFDSNSNIPFGAVTGIDNPGDVVFWAGAENDDISNAHFRIDTNGNVYAGGGYFTGSIITNSKIAATEIETATITGNGGEPALIIRDAKAGIYFQDNGDNVFKLESEEIKSSIPFISEDVIKANRVYAGSDESTYISGLGDNKIGFIQSNLSIAGKESEFIYSFAVNDNNLILQDVNNNQIINANYNTINITTANSGSMNITSSKTSVRSEEINYSGILAYKKNYGGYDLYVSSEN